MLRQRAVPFIQFPIPLVIIIAKQRDFCHVLFATDSLSDSLQLLPDSAGFGYPTIWLIVIIIKPMPINLCSERSSPPAEIQDHVSSMSNALVGP
ncbi:hypothetical protein D3C85_1579160 [compost metagenome]